MDACKRKLKKWLERSKKIPQKVKSLDNYLIRSWNKRRKGKMKKLSGLNTMICAGAFREASWK